MRRTRFHPGPPGRRAGRLGLVVCGVAALAVSTVTVWQSAYATFTDAAPTISTTLGTGTLTLSDDDAAGTMFTAGRLKPGATGTRCIKVSVAGTAPASVRLYGTGRTDTRVLDESLQLTVRAGTGGSTSSCNGFTSTATVYSGTLAGFTAADFATGLGSWMTTGTAATRTFQFTYQLPTTAPTSAQGGSAALNFVWEAQSR
jgi:hypothetical protein